MAYISGEYKIVCGVCASELLRSAAIRTRTGLLAHRKCADHKLVGWDIPAPKVPMDPKPLEAKFISAEGEDVFREEGGLWWDVIDMNWEDIDVDWDKL